MKAKFFLVALFLSLGLATVTTGLTGCAAGARVGPVGAGAHVG